MERDLKLQSLRGENLAALQSYKGPRVQRAQGNTMQTLSEKEPAAETIPGGLRVAVKT